MHRFLNLLLSIITSSLHGKYQIEITRGKSDSINGFNCKNVTGAQVNLNGTCVCTNYSTILSNEYGRLKCENLEETCSNCDAEPYLNESQNGSVDIEFQEEEYSSSCVATLDSSALWNINSTEQGYWHYSNDIKTYLTTKGGDLKVNNSNGQLNGLVLKLQFRCNSTNITQCVMLTIYGTRSYPVTQFNKSLISPNPTTTLTTTPLTILPTTAAETNTATKIERTTPTAKTSTAAARKTTTEAMATSTTTVTTPVKKDERTTTKTTEHTSKAPKSNPMISTSTSDMTGSTSKNSTKIQGDIPIMQKLSDNDQNVTIAAAAASIAMLMIAILLLHLWRQRKKKKSLGEIAKRGSTEVSPELEADYLKPIDARRNSQESTAYEIFGDKFASAVFRYVNEENTRYNEITPYYQGVTPVYTSLSLTEPSGKNHSNTRLEKPYRKMFTCSQDFTDKNVSVTLNPSESPEDDELDGSISSQYYEYFKPVFPDPPKSDQTLPEEHIYRELERPKGGDLTPPANLNHLIF